MATEIESVIKLQIEFGFISIFLFEKKEEILSFNHINGLFSVNWLEKLVGI